MTRTGTILIAAVRASAAFALSLSTAAPATAGDLVFKAPTAVASTYVGEFGMRLWFGRAKTKKDLFDPSGTFMVSRLDYKDLTLAAGEAFTRFDFNNSWFIKGYFGGGGLMGGKLKDEDFPPAIDPYSATLSDQKSGSLFYGSVDLGFKAIRGPDFHVGAFVGYHFMRDFVAAYGCNQIATNPDVCGVGIIPDRIQVINQYNDWHALRVGLEASMDFDRRWRLTVDAAWLPIVRLHGEDRHRLRIGSSPGDFRGPITEDGNGWGYQFDAVLSYRMSDALSVGVGGRYWHVESKGNTHFENHIVGFAASPQPVHWKADHFGAFLQASVKFGPYALIGN